MYCKKCGCRINHGETECSNCGTEVTTIEYCGGFWNLVGEKDKVEKLKKEEEKAYNKSPNDRQTDYKRNEEGKTEPKAQPHDMVKGSKDSSASLKKERKLKNAYKKRSQILSGVIVVVILICLVQTVRLSGSSKKYKQLQNDYKILNQDYQQLNSNYEKLNDDYDKVNSEYKDLKEQLEGEDEDSEALQEDIMREMSSLIKGDNENE